MYACETSCFGCKTTPRKHSRCIAKQLAAIPTAQGVQSEQAIGFLELLEACSLSNS